MYLAPASPWRQEECGPDSPQADSGRAAGATAANRSACGYIARVAWVTRAKEEGRAQYWTQIAHVRAIAASSELYEEDRKLAGCWPRQEAADAIEQAQRLADGYHRQYMRTLRQMRDLRRYAPPVIVNNGGQVNVAANGGQQINVGKD